MSLAYRCSLRCYRRFWPLVLILALVLIALASGAPRYLSFSALAARQRALGAFVHAHPALAFLSYAALYVTVVALSLPASGVMTVTGGVLFGPFLGAAAAAVAASLGATILFLAVRYALAPALAARAGVWMEKLREPLKRDGFNYLLVLRLVPIIPFWLVNLAPALVGMGLLPYVAATVIGVVPASVVFAGLGAGLSDVLAAGRHPDLGLLLSPHVLLPLLGLALLALLPVLWRHRRMFFRSHA